jgi:hypothetical protein
MPGYGGQMMCGRVLPSRVQTFIYLACESVGMRVIERPVPFSKHENRAWVHISGSL